MKKNIYIAPLMDILQLVYDAIILKYGNAARFFWIGDQLFYVALEVGTETAKRFSYSAFNQFMTRIKKLTKNVLHVRRETYQGCLFWCVGLVPGTDEQIAQCRNPEQTIHSCKIFQTMLANEKESCNGECNNQKEDTEPNMKPCLDLLKRVAEQPVSNDNGSSSPSDSQFSSGSPSSYNVPSPDCQPSLPAKRKLEPDSDSDLPSPKRQKIDVTSSTFYSRPDQRSHYNYSSSYSMSRSPTERESPMPTPMNIYFGSSYDVPSYTPLSSNTNQRPNDGLLPDNMVPQDCNASLLSPHQTGSDHATWDTEFGSPASDSQTQMSPNDSQISSSYSVPSYTSNNNSLESYSPDDPVWLPCNPTDLLLSSIPLEDVPLEELMVAYQDGNFVCDALFELDADGLDQIRSALDRGDVMNS